jgi:hypothetical protein
VETLVSAGCYSCLREALALVEAGHAPDRRFDILALLAIRVREIGLRDEWHWRALARAALPPAPSTRDVLVLKLVDQTRGPRGGRIFGDADIVAYEASEILRLAKEYWTVRPHDPVDAYFHLTLACLGLADVPLPAWAGEAVDDLPLVAYRRATCVQADANALAALLAREPRFAEAHYFAAVAALAGGSLLSTEQALDRFEAALPATTASAFLRGQVLMALDEYEPASAQFVQVLAAIPDMPEALLFNLRALSQFDAARGEAAADRLLALGTWYPGEARYWRAWNRRAQSRLDEAAADIAEAKPVLFNAAVPKLAGFIAFERGDMALAEKELAESLDRNEADCEVQFAMGQVLTRTQRWDAAGGRFGAAAACSREAQAALDVRRAEIDAANLDPARRQRLEARVARDRATEHRREGLATLSAAAAYVRADRPSDARRLGEAALEWPEMRDRARDLLAGLNH